MNQSLPVRIILENPPAGVDYCIQKGSGNKYETIQTQRSGGGDLHFTFTISLKTNDDGSPNFLGPIVQGPPAGRFMYVGIGKFAGQVSTIWSRRLKVPLNGISAALIDEILSEPKNFLETKVAGTGKDGSPACGTVKPFAGWKISR